MFIGSLLLVHYSQGIDAIIMAQNLLLETCSFTLQSICSLRQLFLV